MCVCVSVSVSVFFFFCFSLSLARAAPAPKTKAMCDEGRGAGDEKTPRCGGGVSRERARRAAKPPPLVAAVHGP